MIELKHDTLHFSFPEIHDDARMSISFQRTLRIPDDNKVHYLPPGLGSFPLRHVDDFANRIPAAWREHGGVMLPMFQSEALWLNFDSHCRYPFLVKIATGKVNAVSGEAWRDGPNRDPQDYVVVPTQPWLDGYCVKKGEIRQFVAMPLGQGYTTEEQVTGKAEHGGIQIVAYPLKSEVWQKWQAEKSRRAHRVGEDDVACCMLESISMGLAPGGRMKQEIYDDPYPMDVWDLRHSSRCFVHIANSLSWRAITGDTPPTLPPTAAQYSQAGLPWFDFYSDAAPVAGSEVLQGVKTVSEMGKQKGENPLAENEGVNNERVVRLGGGCVVREGE